MVFVSRVAERECDQSSKDLKSCRLVRDPKMTLLCVWPNAFFSTSWSRRESFTVPKKLRSLLSSSWLVLLLCQSMSRQFMSPTTMYFVRLSPIFRKKFNLSLFSLYDDGLLQIDTITIWPLSRTSLDCCICLEPLGSSIFV